jgi:hypothetical protein
VFTTRARSVADARGLTRLNPPSLLGPYADIADAVHFSESDFDTTHSDKDKTLLDIHRAGELIATGAGCSSDISYDGDRSAPSHLASAREAASRAPAPDDRLFVARVSWPFGPNIRGTIFAKCATDSTSSKSNNPPEDSPSRRVTFNVIVAGCIPVFFEHAATGAHYDWHLLCGRQHSGHAGRRTRGEAEGVRVRLYVMPRKFSRMLLDKDSRCLRTKFSTACPSGV